MRISDWSSDVCSSDLKHHKHWKKHGRGHGKHGRAVVIWHGHRHWAPPPKRHFHHYPKPRHRHYRQSSHDNWALYAILALQLVDRLNESQQQSYVWAQQRAVAVPIGESIQWGDSGVYGRSEEHTSELQSLMRISYAVFCLKKKKKKTMYN